MAFGFVRLVACTPCWTTVHPAQKVSSVQPVAPNCAAHSLGRNEVQDVLRGAHHAHATLPLGLHGQAEHLARHLKVGGQEGIAVALPAGRQAGGRTGDARQVTCAGGTRMRGAGHKSAGSGQWLCCGERSAPEGAAQLPCKPCPAPARGLSHTHLTSSQTSPPNRWCTMHVPCAWERRRPALSALVATVPGAHEGTVAQPDDGVPFTSTSSSCNPPPHRHSHTWSK